MNSPYHECMNGQGKYLERNDRTIRIFSDCIGWYLALSHYASEQDVEDGDAEYKGALFFSSELLILYCPFCGTKLQHAEQSGILLLRHILTILASDYNEQRKQVPECIFLPDELGRMANRGAEIARSLFERRIISQESLESIKSINTAFFEMNSSDCSRDVWTNDGVMTDVSWQRIRSLAESSFRYVQPAVSG